MTTLPIVCVVLLVIHIGWIGALAAEGTGLWPPPGMRYRTFRLGIMITILIAATCGLLLLS